MADFAIAEGNLGFSSGNSFAIFIGGDIMKRIQEINIQRWDDNEIEAKEDFVIVEYPFTIFVNDEELVTLLCSPKGLKYLAVGFLVSEGIIKGKEDIEKIILDEDKGHIFVDIKDKTMFAEKLFGKRTITTGCGKGTVFYNVLDSLGSREIKSDIKISGDKILEFSKRLNQESTLFKETGGVHSCILCDTEDILLFHEDVGRHNALDKIIGQALLSDLRLDDKVLISSGRISSEMMIKAIKNNIPMVISRSAPTDLSVKTARKLNATLIGFARGRRMNVYSGQERVVSD